MNIDVYKRGSSMELIEECPGTRSGDPLMDTITVDCLSVFATTSHRTVEKLAPYVAIAFAEVFGGKVGHMEQKEAKGFYYISPQDIVTIIRFDGMDYASWVGNSPDGVEISLKTEGSDSTYKCTCSIQTEGQEYTSYFEADTERDAELLALLIGCVSFRREDPYLYDRLSERGAQKGTSFDDNLAGMLPPIRTEVKKGFFRKLLIRLAGGS